MRTVYNNSSYKKVIIFLIVFLISSNIFSTEVNVKSMSGLSDNNTLFFYDFYTEILKFNPAYAIRFEDKATICFPDCFSFEYEKKNYEKKSVDNLFNPFVIFSYKNIVGGAKFDSSFSNKKDIDVSENDFFFGGTLLTAFSMKNKFPFGIRTSFLLRQNEKYFNFDISCGTILKNKKHELSFFVPLKYTYNEEDLWKNNLFTGVSVKDSFKKNNGTMNIFSTLYTDFYTSDENLYFSIPLKIGYSYERSFLSRFSYFLGTDILLSIDNKALNNNLQLEKKDNETFFNFYSNINLNAGTNVLINKKVCLYAGVLTCVIDYIHKYYSREYSASKYEKKYNDLSLFLRPKFSVGVSVKPVNYIEFNICSELDNFTISVKSDEDSESNSTKNTQTKIKFFADIVIYL